MTEKPAAELKQGEHPAQDNGQPGDSVDQQENQALEEKVWALFRDIQAAPDKETQEAIREKMWRLAAGRV
ncbi:hypothetical protein O3W44_20070 [Pantoea sp. LMR881]|uniref:hypothetical protein n=1 Tax=Pantoea sp. LMR881 TaxID=3014336 RepID=UPI0022AF424C|nr:hypothetical protein [Pantoea sp. LMR881]MCZ4060888.1 hypothetical protein [Pantoea sp. LMR881]